MAIGLLAAVLLGVLPAKVRQAIVSYIEGNCNRQRLHSGLDYKTPRAVHDAYTTQQKAA